MDEVYRAFLTAAGQQTADIGEVKYVLADVIAELGKTQQAAVETNRTVKTVSPPSDGGSNPLLTVLKNGLGVAPLIGGIISLFSGGSDEPAPLVKYAMPQSVDFQAAEVGGQVTSVGYDQAGMARGSSSTSQVTVNVQAMDARSFLDRSGDIAAAVRDAMLNLNSINDVVNDL